MTLKGNYPPIKTIIQEKVADELVEKQAEEGKGGGQKRLSHVVGVSPASSLQPGVQSLLLESGF